MNLASTPTLYTTNNQYITPHFATLQTLQVPISHKTKFSFPKKSRQIFNYPLTFNKIQNYNSVRNENIKGDTKQHHLSFLYSFF